jgi:hypothetical protein
MKRVLKNLVGLGCWTAAILLVASVTILPAATAGDEDTVEDISKVKSTGENISAACDTTTANLDKRGKLAYDKDTGSIKYDVSAEKAE